MNCLCCGKPMRVETETGWHVACIKRFFGTSRIPEIELTEEALKRLAEESVHHGYTIPGVQKKISLHLSAEQKPRLTIVDYPTGYILKPQVEEYPYLPESEQLVMTMAEQAGIATVPHGLIRLNGQAAYITRRVDRVLKDGQVQRLAMEDFCQLDLRLTQDKYRGSYERCGKLIERYSERAGLDASELFIRLVFSFLVGNSDMHLKNFSLLETAQGSRQYRLAPAYDLLPVNLILPEDREDFALTMNGKKQHVRRKDFLAYADAIGVPRKAAERMMAGLIRLIPQWEKRCSESLLPEEMQRALIRLMHERADRMA